MTIRIKHVLLAATAAAFGLMAAASAEEKHNFIDRNLTWATPQPLAKGEFRRAVDLLDSESITHNGDYVEYELLDLQKTAIQVLPNAQNPHPPKAVPKLEATVSRYVVSCGWRTERRLPAGKDAAWNSLAAVFSTQQFTQESFLGPHAQENKWLDDVCADKPVTFVKGAASVQEAIDFWKDNFGERDFNTILVQRAEPKQYPVDWMQGERRHRYMQLSIASPTGTTLFFDRGNLHRRGTIAETLTLTFLGPAAQSLTEEMSTSVMLRRMRYDCRARTSTVLAQAGWNRFGDFRKHSEDSYGTRTADQSPVTAAEVDAACTEKALTGQSFSSLEDVWTFSAAQWPEPTQAVWAVCVWNRFPDDVRTRFLDGYRSHVAPPETMNVEPRPWERGTDPLVIEVSRRDMLDRTPELPKADPGAYDACKVPVGSRTFAYWAVNAYGVQRGAIEALSKRGITEAAILAAWRELPWLKRQGFIRSNKVLRKETVETRIEVQNSLFQRLGARDFETRHQMVHYLKAQATLEST